jgi:integrase
LGGQNPIALLERADRPKTASQAKRKRIFSTDELRQTIAAAREPYRTLFCVLAGTGARISELLALKWETVC